MPYYSIASGKGLHGRDGLWAYLNSDGQLRGTNCGLAAAATALCANGLYTDDGLGELEDRFPPDVFFGEFGCSKSRVCEILSAYKCRWHEVYGHDGLKDTIRHQHLVLVMLSLPGILPLGHWMVAYAYDRHHVHLTNFHHKNPHHPDQMKWDRFLEGWGAVLPALIGMDYTGIAVR